MEKKDVIMVILLAFCVLGGLTNAFPDNTEAAAKASDFISAHSGEFSQGINSNTFTEASNNGLRTFSDASSWTAGFEKDVLDAHVALEIGSSDALAMNGKNVAYAATGHSSTAINIPELGIFKTSTDAEAKNLVIGNGEASSDAEANALFGPDGITVSGSGSAQAQVGDTQFPFVNGAPGAHAISSDCKDKACVNPKPDNNNRDDSCKDNHECKDRDGCKDHNGPGDDCKTGCDNNAPTNTTKTTPTSATTVAVFYTESSAPVCLPNVLITGIEPRGNYSGKVKIANTGCAEAIMSGWTIETASNATVFSATLLPGQDIVLKLDNFLPNAGIIVLKNAAGTEIDKVIYSRPEGMISYVWQTTWKWVSYPLGGVNIID